MARQTLKHVLLLSLVCTLLDCSFSQDLKMDDLDSRISLPSRQTEQDKVLNASTAKNFPHEDIISRRKNKVMSVLNMQRSFKGRITRRVKTHKALIKPWKKISLKNRKRRTSSGSRKPIRLKVDSFINRNLVLEKGDIRPIFDKFEIGTRVAKRRRQVTAQSGPGYLMEGTGFSKDNTEHSVSSPSSYLLINDSSKNNSTSVSMILNAKTTNERRMRDVVHSKLLEPSDIRRHLVHSSTEKRDDVEYDPNVSTRNYPIIVLGSSFTVCIIFIVVLTVWYKKCSPSKSKQIWSSMKQTDSIKKKKQSKLFSPNHFKSNHKPSTYPGVKFIQMKKESTSTGLPSNTLKSDSMEKASMYCVPSFGTAPSIFTQVDVSDENDVNTTTEETSRTQKENTSHEGLRRCFRKSLNPFDTDNSTDDAGLGEDYHSTKPNDIKRILKESGSNASSDGYMSIDDIQEFLLDEDANVFADISEGDEFKVRNITDTAQNKEPMLENNGHYNYYTDIRPLLKFYFPDTSE